jgi:hypothetical protein
MGVAPRTGTTAGTKLALIHAAAEEVRDGHLESEVPPAALSITVADLLEGRAAKRADAQNRGVSG